VLKRAGYSLLELMIVVSITIFALMVVYHGLLHFSKDIDASDLGKQLANYVSSVERKITQDRDFDLPSEGYTTFKGVDFLKSKKCKGIDAAKSDKNYVRSCNYKIKSSLINKEIEIHIYPDKKGQVISDIYLGPIGTARDLSEGLFNPVLSAKVLKKAKATLGDDMHGGLDGITDFHLDDSTGEITVQLLTQKFNKHKWIRTKLEGDEKEDLDNKMYEDLTFADDEKMGIGVIDTPKRDINNIRSIELLQKDGSSPANIKANQISGTFKREDRANLDVSALKYTASAKNINIESTENRNKSNVKLNADVINIGNDENTNRVNLGKQNGVRHESNASTYDFNLMINIDGDTEYQRFSEIDSVKNSAVILRNIKMYENQSSVNVPADKPCQESGGKQKVVVKTESEQIRSTTFDVEPFFLKSSVRRYLYVPQSLYLEFPSDGYKNEGAIFPIGFDIEPRSVLGGYSVSFSPGKATFTVMSFCDYTGLVPNEDK